MESLYKAQEMYKDLLRRCPHHELPTWLQVQIFYNDLGTTTRTMIDVVAGGALMSKKHDETYELLEEMTSNNYQLSMTLGKIYAKKVIGVHEIDDVTALSAQVATLFKQLGSLNVVLFKRQVKHVSCVKEITLVLIVKLLAPLLPHFPSKPTLCRIFKGDNIILTLTLTI